MERPEPTNAPFARFTLLVLAIVGFALLSAGASAAHAQTRTLGDSKVFANFFPAPGPFFAVIDVYVGDKGDKLATPNIK